MMLPMRTIRFEAGIKAMKKKRAKNRKGFEARMRRQAAAMQTVNAIRVFRFSQLAGFHENSGMAE